MRRLDAPIVHERAVGRLQIDDEAAVLARQHRAVPPRDRQFVDLNVAGLQPAERDGLPQRQWNDLAGVGALRTISSKGTSGSGRLVPGDDDARERGCSRLP